MKRTISSTQKDIKDFIPSSSDEPPNKKPLPPTKNEFIEEIMNRRLSKAESVLDFKYLKTRVRVLSKASDVKENCNSILYWMQRDSRVQDNWAFLFAQKLALKLELPLMVAVCLPPPLLSKTLRHYKFLLDGWQHVEKECSELNIPFTLLQGVPEKVVCDFVKTENIGALVCDFSPLREARSSVKELCKNLPKDVAFTQVDAHNIVPLWVASDKLRFIAARE